MTRYAAKTDVSEGRSREQIERLLGEHGADGFMYGWSMSEGSRLEFSMEGRHVRFVLPPLNEQDFGQTATGRVRSTNSVLTELNQAKRQQMRALFLVVRAKLEAIESHISSFDNEFLAFIVGPNNRTIGDQLVPLLEAGNLSTGIKMLTTGGR